MTSKSWDGGYLAAIEKHRRALNAANGHQRKQWLLWCFGAALVVAGLAWRLTK